MARYKECCEAPTQLDFRGRDHFWVQKNQHLKYYRQETLLKYYGSCRTCSHKKIKIKQQETVLIHKIT